MHVVLGGVGSESSPEVGTPELRSKGWGSINQAVFTHAGMGCVCGRVTGRAPMR